MRRSLCQSIRQDSLKCQLRGQRKTGGGKVPPGMPCALCQLMDGAFLLVVVLTHSQEEQDGWFFEGGWFVWSSVAAGDSLGSGGEEHDAVQRLGPKLAIEWQ